MTIWYPKVLLGKDFLTLSFKNILCPVSYPNNPIFGAGRTGLLHCCIYCFGSLMSSHKCSIESVCFIPVLSMLQTLTVLFCLARHVSVFVCFFSVFLSLSCYLTVTARKPFFFLATHVLQVFYDFCLSCLLGPELVTADCWSS